MGTSSFKALSTGAKGGIGVGAAFICLASIAIVLLLLIYRRQRKPAALGKGDLEEVVERSFAKSEADGLPIFELRAKARPFEADSMPRAELEGERPGDEFKRSNLAR